MRDRRLREVLAFDQDLSSSEMALRDGDRCSLAAPRLPMSSEPSLAEMFRCHSADPAP
jgi:hypothetical protein